MHNSLVDVGVRAESSETARAEENLSDVKSKHSSVVELPLHGSCVLALHIKDKKTILVRIVRLAARVTQVGEP